MSHPQLQQIQHNSALNISCRRGLAQKSSCTVILGGSATDILHHPSPLFKTTIAIVVKYKWTFSPEFLIEILLFRRTMFFTKYPEIFTTILFCVCICLVYLNMGMFWQTGQWRFLYLLETFKMVEISSRFPVLFCTHCLLELTVGSVSTLPGKRVRLARNGLFTTQCKSHSKPSSLVRRHFAKTSIDASVTRQNKLILTCQ
ncbi:hypothetical protein CLF_100386 [Clonorchis sinensis]|uniref:Uncharacterized protein n=1 Tax=Clonorchis sinensis TaxID=79923 RepID=G7Y3B9_CLOSI|nr:hypothetical protein CLF_100386 [Clonorchis sinensis]